jgi:hypothetical protein
MSSLNDAKADIKKTPDPEIYPDLIPVKLSRLVPPPVPARSFVPVLAQEKKVSAITGDFSQEKSGFMHDGTVKKKTPKPVQKDRVVAKKQAPLTGTSKKSVPKKTKAAAPSKELNKQNTAPIAQDPKLKRVSAEVQEKKLRARQKKMTDIFDDKGTVS